MDFKPYEIFRCIAGSNIHGLQTAESDVDEFAIFMEPIEYVVGFQHIESVVGKQDGKDVTAHSLRKFLKLALAGNPTIIEILFVPPENVINGNSKWLHNLQTQIVSKQVGPKYRGYLNSQIKRMDGIIKGHMPKRVELTEKFGFDTKYAMHALRLGLQGIEILETGKVRLPIPHDPGDYLRAVRAGEYSFADVRADLADLEEGIVNALRASELPEHPDYKLVEDFQITQYLNFWGN